MSGMFIFFWELAQIVSPGIAKAFFSNPSRENGRVRNFKPDTYRQGLVYNYGGRFEREATDYIHMTMNILTRAARKKAGISPPSPFFKSKIEHNCYQQSIQETASHKEKQVERNDLSISEYNNPVSTNVVKGDVSSNNWIQCDDCKKWRKVSNSTQHNLKNEWYCHMNYDTAYQSCEISEEEWEVPHGFVYTYGGIEQGQLVWGKLNRYPPWPAIVTPDPWSSYDFKDVGTEGCIYHVEFLGKTRTHSWLPEEMVEPYRDTCSIGVKCCPRDMKHIKKLQDAIVEADRLLKLSNEERLHTCEYTVVKKEQSKGNEENKYKQRRLGKMASKDEKIQKRNKAAVKKLKQCSKLERSELVAILQQLGVDITSTTKIPVPPVSSAIKDVDTSVEIETTECQIMTECHTELHSTEEPSHLTNSKTDQTTKTSIGGGNSKCNLFKTQPIACKNSEIAKQFVPYVSMKQKRKTQKTKYTQEKRKRTSLKNISSSQTIVKYCKPQLKATPVPVFSNTVDEWNDQVVPSMTGVNKTEQCSLLDTLEEDAWGDMRDIEKLLSNIDDESDIIIHSSEDSLSCMTSGTKDCRYSENTQIDEDLQLLADEMSQIEGLMRNIADI